MWHVWMTIASLNNNNTLPSSLLKLSISSVTVCDCCCLLKSLSWLFFMHLVCWLFPAFSILTSYFSLFYFDDKFIHLGCFTFGIMLQVVFFSCIVVFVVSIEAFKKQCLCWFLPFSLEGRMQSWLLIFSLCYKQ